MIWVFSLHSSYLENPHEFEIKFIKPDGKAYIGFKLLLDEDSAASNSSLSRGELHASYRSGDITISALNSFLVNSSGWSSLLLQISNMVIDEPSDYKIILEGAGHSWEIGRFRFCYSRYPDFEPEELRAMQANPDIPRSAVINLSCKECGTVFKAYTSLERRPDLEEDGAVWQYNLQNEFRCNCSKTIYNLKHLRESMHGMLAHNTRGLPTDYISRYTRQNVQSIIDRYILLLSGDHPESMYQVFIEENPLLLAYFHPKKWYPKGSVMGLKETDFTVLDQQGCLHLIEIEKPQTKLFTKDGQPRHELTHAYQQVLDWIALFEEHPSAVLETLKLSRSDVSSVTGVVVAGRTTREDAKLLKRHRMTQHHKVKLLTFDDIHVNLRSIMQNLP
ncbi:Shedu anti-phage system protein SduA domain-containing protein [Desulfocurvibacter africanus]|uniref:Shedu anti-phage system protein SduA domain-containing protein n=1 Tax=Desulfocurvibacter africanus TaxID=873 RepID=UPI001378F7C8|nr:Shedu anti-phage system protein SduA domain-containing protein [Desulfocurvibacter africanus]